MDLLRLRAAIKKCLQEDEFKKALVLCEKLVGQQNVKLTFDDWVSKGLCHFKLGQYQQAIQDYDVAIRMKPDDAETYFYRGTAYHDLGQYQRAIEDYDEAIRLKSNSANVYSIGGFLMIPFRGL